MTAMTAAELIGRTLTRLQDADGIVATPDGAGIPLGHGTLDHDGMPVDYRAWRTLDGTRAYMHFEVEPTDRWAHEARQACPGWPADTVHVASYQSDTDDSVIFEHLIF